MKKMGNYTSEEKQKIIDLSNEMIKKHKELIGLLESDNPQLWEVCNLWADSDLLGDCIESAVLRSDSVVVNENGTVADGAIADQTHDSLLLIN